MRIPFSTGFWLGFFQPSSCVRTFALLAIAVGAGAGWSARPEGSEPSSPQPGGRIYFSSYRDGRWQIYSVSPDGSGLTRVSNGGGPDWDPSPSPDGTSIVFASGRAGTLDTVPPDPRWFGGDNTIYKAELYLMRVDGSDVRRLTFSRGVNQYPAWAPDGRSIGFTSNRNSVTQIYTLALNDTAALRLTNSMAFNFFGGWSTDGRKVVFASNGDAVGEGNVNNMDIYVMDSDGKNPTRLTRDPAFDGNPSWSPDGTRIAFASTRSGQMDIWVMNRDGSGPVRLTRSSEAEEWPAWAPDGQMIAFSAVRSGNSDIYLMNADGSNVTRLTDDPSADTRPAWSR
jgi:Tol biopolymer transport system component